MQGFAGVVMIRLGSGSGDAEEPWFLRCRHCDDEGMGH